MPNGTYGGVRGRKTKAGGKLTTFVFLLLDYIQFHFKFPVFTVFIVLRIFIIVCQ